MVKIEILWAGEVENDVPIFTSGVGVHASGRGALDVSELMK